MRYLILVLYLCWSVSAPAAIKVVTTIPPINALAASVMADISTPTSLLKAGDSPHNFALTPAGARKLANADLIIWLGPNFETFLTKIVSNNHDPDKVLTLSKNPKLKQLPVRRGNLWPGHQHHHEHHTDNRNDHHTDHHDDHSESIADDHIWLSVDNAKVIVNAIGNKLIALDPEHKAQYQHNMATSLAQLTSLDNELRAKLLPVKEQPYLVYHDAYQYLEQSYELNPIGALTAHPDLPPSAHHLHQTMQQLDLLNVKCVFSDSNDTPPIVTRLAESADLNTGVLEPLSSGTTPTSIDSYLLLMRQMTDSLVSCLAGSGLN